MLGWFLGILASLLLAANTLIWCSCIYLLAVFNLLVPVSSLRAAVSRLMVRIAETWIAFNSQALDLLHHIRWDVRGIDSLSMNRCYLVSVNHQSWVDIVILQKVFNRRIPFLRFFIKQQLVYVPLLGLAWVALDFPRMKRYSKEFLEKHPEKRGEDLAMTRKICERLKGKHISVLNFLEGTRFTKRKHDKQNSPYPHLLKPKTGGLAFVIESMGEQFYSLLDVTIVYPEGAPSLWDLLCGKVKMVIVEVQERKIPTEFLRRSYIEDSEHREQMQAWVSAIWADKENRITQLLSGG
jgi:1-acyl-sn-glycerol-3-phosphate acyltransferase